MLLQRFLRLFLVPVLFMATLSTATLDAKEMTQDQRNEMAAKLIPIITMLLMDDGDRVAPDKPTLTTPVGSEASSGTQSVEVNGEVGAKVYVNGVEAGTVGSNGKVTIELTFTNGNNVMSITLKDPAGNESEALVFTVSYDAPPVITLNGDENTYVVVGEGFSDLGAVATDANDGTVSVNVSGTVDDATVGDYNLTYTASDSHANTAQKIRIIHILPAGASNADLPMDLTKVDGFAGATEPAKLAGEVSNQYWVQSFGALSEAELRTIVAKYSVVSVVGYSNVYGLLVEIPLDNIEAKSAIKSIELEEKITNVRHRIYIGADRIKLDSITPPNDDVSGYFDEGDNWHLEYIDILRAWDITTGSADVAVGIVDAGFYANHEDVTIKTRNNLSKGVQHSHGTGAASIIGADTNNDKGVTGINWSSPLVVSIFKDYDTNISYQPENYFKDIFELSEDHSKVKLVNCSFGVDPYKNIIESYSTSRKKYDVTRKYKNKLFIFSAGNEHNDTALTNGALHINRNLENMTQKDNVLIVAALLKDGTLPYYSNYGDTVDIAAPTSMKAAKNVEVASMNGAVFWASQYAQVNESKYYGTDFDAIYNSNPFSSSYTKSLVFNGTSAAAPVVTGVASLIYSLNPDFTPQEVKKILFDSTGGKKVCTRHTTQNYTDESLTETLPDRHCIPVLNAGNALTLAKQIVDAQKASLLHYYPSPFSNICHVYINPPSNLTIESLELSVQGEKRTDDSWEDISINASDDTLSVLSDNTHELAFSTDRIYRQYKIVGTLTYTGYTPIDINLTLEHTLVEDYTEFKDKITGEFLDGVEVMIDYLDGFTSGNILGLGKIVDKNVTLYLEQSRQYKATVKKDNYKPFTTYAIYKNGSELFSTGVLNMVNISAEPKGNLLVLARNENADMISNAHVEMVTSSTTVNNTYTDIWGIVKLLNIPILDDADKFIKYDVNISRLGYLSAVKTIALVDGKTVTENITLKKDPNYTNIPPVANAGVDKSIQVGESITLSGALSSDVETGTAYLQYKWSGATIATSYEQNVTLTNLSEGTHHIVLQVTDEEGAVSTDTVTVTVANGTITHNNTTYGTVTSPYTGKVWLDRNLGAAQVCTSSTDTACYGDYYQWGRNYDGHQSSTSSTTNTQATNVSSAGSSFIKGSSDWASVDGSGTTRTANWSATDGTSVCPAGFRVPTLAELEAETVVNGVTNSATAFSNFLRLPTAGYRGNYSGPLDGQGSWGDVWASSVDDSGSEGVGFDSGNAYSLNYSRATGCTVRCLRD